MNTGIQKNRLLRIVMLSALGLILLGSQAFCKEIKKVAVLPFIINSQQDLTFLQKGIFDMFSSRISWVDEVDVLTREELEAKLKNAPVPFSFTQGVNEAQAKSLGQFLGVDHVLFGSVTLFGNSMSLDVNMVDIKQAVPALTFFRQGNEAGAVIPELNTIAEEINFKVFGREPEDFKSQLALRGAYPSEGENYASPLTKFAMLASLTGRINAIAVADLDGDQKNEVIVAQDKAIKIYKFGFNAKMEPVHTIEGSSVLKNIHVAVSDVNNNGYPEIFVTRINNAQQSVSSGVIEYNSGAYIEHKEAYPWYFNVISDPLGNDIVLAQVHTKKGPWQSERVFKVMSEGSGYTLGEKFRAPEENFSVLSMARGRAGGEEQNGLALYTDQKGRLTLFNSETGKIEWTGDEGHGGSDLSYDIPATEANAMYHIKHVFLQPQSNFFDMDEDGKAELFVIRNPETSDYLLENVRSFRKGSLEFLSLNAMGGYSNEKASKKLPGPITSIYIGDYDNDSKMELLVSMIKTNDTVLSMSQKQCILGAYELE